MLKLLVPIFRVTIVPCYPIPATLLLAELACDASFEEGCARFVPRPDRFAFLEALSPFVWFLLSFEPTVIRPAFL